MFYLPIGLDSVFAAVNVVFLETEALIADEAIAITVAAAALATSLEIGVLEK